MGPWKEKGQGLPTRACPLPVHPKAMRAKLSETLTCDQVGVAPIKPLPPPPNALNSWERASFWGWLSHWPFKTTSRRAGRGRVQLSARVSLPDHGSAPARLDELEEITSYI